MFKGKLFSGQTEGAQFLCARKTGVLAWEQGTGKTIISLASSEKLLDLGYVKPFVLVIAPSAIAWQWKEKIEEFTTNEATLVHAKSEYRGTYVCPTPYVVTSYNLFRRDFETIKTVPWDLVICDEAQEFKNNKTKTAKLLKRLNTEIQPPYRWALTGTVISNRLEELYSIMYWVDRKFFPPWDIFEERHIVRNKRTKAITKYKGLQSINRSLPRRLHRRTQDEVGDMPKLVVNTHYIEKEKELKDAELTLLDHLDNLAELVISGDGTLGPAHSPEVSRAFAEVKRLLASPNKIKYCAAMVRGVLAESSRNRGVIFSHEKDPLWDLREQLNKAGIQCFSFTGDQTAEEKRENVLRFKQSQSILLCSNAGKAGLDLPFANYLWHLDVPFSFEIDDQRNKRITRLVSEFTSVKANYLVVKGSMEEYYRELVKAKGLLSQAVYTGHADEIIMKTQSLRGFLHDARRTAKI